LSGRRGRGKKGGGEGEVSLRAVVGRERKKKKKESEKSLFVCEQTGEKERSAGAKVHLINRKKRKRGKEKNNG